ncbi:helix-turn-helix domain-containing protein [Sphingomonas sp. SM33]|uniref:Helix-turn-helix domain-containing protein n=1 Tax=Sphingomonas telluris TaxID=2907998 RepID=A0ABS9VLR8_9SPHN|nr:helix-turn-helix domain-containing protein [Sphingomonas telluris]MCH8615906.1 helix-turn-helix domain-containing protein [Sphingomonas telluris]
MPKKHRNLITEKKWLKAVDAYELGHRNGSQLARELGVSPATVSRELKRRGALKGRRVAETLVELEVSLTTKARQRARERSLKEIVALERVALLNVMIEDMVKSVLTAGGAEELALAASKVAEVREALGR